jgi:Tol biopolymer transport system component
MKLKSSELKFYADVYTWFPNGQIKKVSAGDGIYYQPCIHPDGTRAVYSGNSSGVPRIWNVELLSGDITPLTSTISGSRHPAFSWDGKKIVFTSDRGSNKQHERIEDMGPDGAFPRDLTLNLFIMDSDGRNVTQLTSGSYQDQRPSFSPDGKYVVFVANRSHSYPSLWVVPTDASSAPKPVLNQGWGYRPWYSTDGNLIYFFTDINKRHQICQIPSEGGNIVPLPNDDVGQSHGPFTDPGGDSLLMHSTRGGNWEIWELPLDGSPPRSLQPPGFKSATHPTRANNGIITFDSIRFKK